MMMLNRVNRLGMSFKLREVFGEKDKTRIDYQDKHIIVNANIRQIDQAWYAWVMKGQYIQSAFLFMTPDQREFIMTGITPDERKEMFKDDDAN